MKLVEIKNAISNSIEMNRVLSEANRIKLNARDGVGAKAERSAEIYDGKITAIPTKQLLVELQRKNRIVNPDKIFEQIQESCAVIAREAGALEDMLSNEVRTVIMREALNIKEAQILEFIAVSDFFLSMSRMLMVATAEFEINQLRGEQPDKASLRYFGTNFNTETITGFANCIAFFLKHKQESVIEKIYELPDIKVDQKVLDTVQSTEGRQKIDPAGLNLLNIINPIAWAYAFQKAWSEIKLKRLELNNEELEYLELRYQELLLERQNRSNPQLEEKIKRYMDTIQIKRTKIERLKKTMG